MTSSKPRAKKHKVVIVAWGDAFIDTSSFKISEAKDTTPVYTKTVGFLIAKNPHGIVLATDLFDDEPDDAVTKLFIPKGMIVNITYLEEAP